MNEDQLLDTIGQIYDAATDPAQLKRLANVIAGAVDSESAILFTARRPSGALVRLIGATANFDDAARADYRAYYHDRNERFLRLAKLNAPYVGRGSELLQNDKFDRTEFCADFCSRIGIYHVLAATVPVADDVFGAIGVHRSRSAIDFGDDHRRVLSAVAPHLDRALQIAHRLDIARSERDLSLEILYELGGGVLLLDRDCRVLLMNAVAERIARAARWFAVSHGIVRCTQPMAARNFESTVATAAETSAGQGHGAGGVVRLTDSAGEDLAVLIAPFRSAELELGPMRSCAMLLFADPEAELLSREDRIAAAYRLTPAEARLVAGLVQGHTLPSYARAAGISINTAKAQLRSVFLKTGFTTQTALVAATLANPVLRVRPAAP